MQIIENIALISINETLVVQLVSFLIFLFIINRIMIRPLRTTMEERENYIKKMQQEIVDSGQKLDDIMVQSIQEEREIRQSAHHMVAEIEESGNQEARLILEGVKSDIADQRREAQRDIENQLTEAMRTVEKDVRELSVGIMEKVLGRKVAP